MRTPAFTVVAGAAEVTRLVQERLIELRVTLTSDRASDTVEIGISDVRGELAIPAAERELHVSFGYQETELVPMGIYFHDESEVELVPRRLTVRGTAADFRKRSTLKAPRRRSWDQVSLGDLVATVAAEHGYVARVAPNLAGIVIPHLDQTAESDLHLLRRLARHFDATAKAAGRHLVFAPRGSQRSAGSLQPLPVVRLDATDLLSARYVTRGRPRYGSVTASYQDLAAGELVHVTAGSGGPTYAIREPFATEEEARSAAAARLTRYSRQTEVVELSISGDPALASESVVELRDWPSPGPTRWTVERAEHTLSKTRGYVTGVTAEPAE